MKRKFIAILSLMLCATSLLQFPAYAKQDAKTSLVNDSGGEVPIILDQKYWYKVQLPATIDLKLDANSDYSDDFTISAQGVALGKWLHVDTSDVTLTDEHNHELTIANKMRKDESDTWVSNYTHESNLSEDGISFAGKAWVNSKDVQPGNYEGIADYKFYLTDHKHTVETSTVYDWRGTSHAKFNHSDESNSCPKHTGPTWYLDKDSNTQYNICSECGHKVNEKPVYSYKWNGRPDYIGSELGYNSGYYRYYYDYYNKDQLNTYLNSGYDMYIPNYFRYNGEWYQLTGIGNGKPNGGMFYGSNGFVYTFRYDGTKEEFSKIKLDYAWRVTDSTTIRWSTSYYYVVGVNVICTDGTISYPKQYFLNGQYTN